LFTPDGTPAIDKEKATMKHTEVTADGHKKTRRTRRIAVVSAAALAVAVGGGVAYAYWTAGGSGTGTAGTGTTQTLTVNQDNTSPITNLYPGGPAQNLSGTFTNPNPGPIYVAGVELTISSVTKAVGAPAGPCTADDYTITQPNDVNAEVVTGTAWSGATIAMKNTSSNQDGCKGATVNLHYEVN
jgi:hypothetical protein